jgi:hypothetical protein
MADNENEFDDFDIGPQSDEMAWDEMDDADNRDFPTEPETKPVFGEPNQSEWDEQPDFIEPYYYDDEDGDQEYRAYMYGSGRY